MPSLLSHRLFVCWFVTCGLLFSFQPGRANEAEEKKAIAKWIPRTAKKLALRDSDSEVRAVVLGDSISQFYQPNPEQSLNLEDAWHRRFLERLAGEYYFTGGVRDASTGKSKKQKKLADADKVSRGYDPEEGPEASEPLNFDTPGPDISVECLARNGATAAFAVEALSTDALDSDPDLVLMMYGMQDAFYGGSLSNFRASLETALKLCKAKGVDVILAGPPLMVNGQDRRLLGLSRAYSSVAQDVANQAGVLFLDSGAAQARCPVEVGSNREETGFQKMFRHLRSQYEHHGKEDPLHPNEVGHEIIADALWATLVNGPAVEPVQLNGSVILPDKTDGETVLQLDWKVPGEKPRDVKREAVVEALGVDRMLVPQMQLSEEQTERKLSAAQMYTNSLNGLHQSIPVKATSPAIPDHPVAAETPFGEEPFLRGSALLNEGSVLRMVDFKAPIIPVSVAFALGRLEGMASELPLAVTVTNQLPAEFNGTAEITWLGKTQSVPLKLAANSSNPLKVGLPLPGKDSPRVSKNTVVIRLKSKDSIHEFRREIELARDIILDEKISLTNRLAPSDDESVRLTCKAEQHGLYLVLDLPPAQSNTSKSQPSAMVEITLDARGPADRGKVGFCEPLMLDVPWQDGRFEVRRVAPGLFGPGYGAEREAPDPGGFIASITTQRDNRRQLRLSIPRNYLYLHSWNLGESGQNTLGINVIASLIDFADGATQGTFPLKRSFTVVAPGIYRNDALALGVLKLSTKGPNWSARIY